MTVFNFKVNKEHVGLFPRMDFGSDFNENRYKQFLKDNEGKVVKIENQISTRSLSQNALYWLYLGVIEQETGNTAHDLHELFRRTLLPPKFIKVMGKEIKIPMSTTELKKTAFGEYLDKIAAESGVPIPDTEEYAKWRDSAPMVDE